MKITKVSGVFIVDGQGAENTLELRRYGYNVRACLDIDVMDDVHVQGFTFVGFAPAQRLKALWQVACWLFLGRTYLFMNRFHPIAEADVVRS